MANCIANCIADMNGVVFLEGEAVSGGSDGEGSKWAATSCKRKADRVDS
jgi:hypothetical protein